MAATNTIGIIIAAKNESAAAFAAARNDVKATSSEVNALGAESDKTGGALSGKLIGGLVAVGATAAIFTTAIIGAANFQQQLVKLTTSAGESTSNLTLVSSGIKDLAIQTGASVTDLADGMYKIESGGQHGADGLKVLKAAEQGAKAEGSDLTTVSDALSSVLVDYKLKADDAANVTSKLVAATAAGKMSFQDLAAAMPAILPIASAAHVSLDDILGDMASMTVHGMSAQQSAQNLADTIRHMQNPTAQQAKELSLLGLTTTQLASDMAKNGLSGTLQEISGKIANLMPAGSDKVILSLKTALNGLSPAVQALGAHLFDGTMSAKDYALAAQSLDPISAKQATSFATLAGSMHRIGDQQMSGSDVMQNYGQALAKATGDATGLNVALMLTGDNAKGTNAAVKSVKDATAEAGNNVKGWSEIQGNFNTKLQQFKQWASVASISLGQELLPAATAVLDGFIGLNKSVADSETWLGKHQTAVKLAAGVLTILFGPALVGVAATATASGVKIVASAVASGAGWVLNAAKASLEWELQFAKIVAAGVVTAAKTGAQAVVTSAKWVAEAAVASGAWVINELPKIVAAGVVTSAKAVIHAADTSAAWVLNAIRVSVVWTTQEMPKLIVSFVKTSASATKEAAVSSAAWVVNSAKTSVAWVVTELPKIVTGFVVTSAAATVNSAKSSAAWVKEAAVTSFVWVTTELPKIVVGFGAVVISALASAPATSKSWVVSAVTSSTAWVVEEIPKIIAGFVAMVGAAYANAGATTAAWVASATASSAAFEALVALVTTPLVMPAIAVAAAIASIGLVIDAINTAKNALDAMNAADQAQTSAKSITASQDSHYLSIVNDKVSSPNAKKLATQYLHNEHYPGFADGGFTGQGATNDIAGLVHRGEYVLPKSAVNQSTGTPKGMGGGSALTINGGMHIHNEMDEDRFLKKLSFRLSLQ